MNQDETNGPRFIKHLEESISGVWEVAKWLHSRGHPVTVNPVFVRPSHDQWKDYTDEGDIFITQRIEVKVLSAEFTNKADWPFGGKFIVCAKHAWDRAFPKPYAFIYLNKSRSHAAILMGDTSARWYTEERTDRRYEKVKQSFYFCPLEDVKFIRFNQGDET